MNGLFFILGNINSKDKTFKKNKLIWLWLLNDFDLESFAKIDGNFDIHGWIGFILGQNKIYDKYWIIKFALNLNMITFTHACHGWTIGFCLDCNCNNCYLFIILVHIWQNNTSESTNILKYSRLTLIYFKMILTVKVRLCWSM
jgi:hypothetical protein